MLITSLSVSGFTRITATNWTAGGLPGPNARGFRAAQTQQRARHPELHYGSTAFHVPILWAQPHTEDKLHHPPFFAVCFPFPHHFRHFAFGSGLLLPPWSCFIAKKSITPSPSSYPTHSSPAASPHTPLAARRAPHLCAQPRSATGARRATRCGGAREWRRAGPPLSTRLRPCGHSRCRLAAARWRCALKLPAARSEPFSTAEDASSRWLTARM